MSRLLLLGMAGALLAACDATGTRTDPTADPSAEATMGESIAQPSDGFENEVSTDG